MTKDSFEKMIDIAFTRLRAGRESNLILMSRDEAEFGFACNLIVLMKTPSSCRRAAGVWPQTSGTWL
jgi:hypothetical protein